MQKTQSIARSLTVVMLGLAASQASGADFSSRATASRFRQPVALAVSRDGAHLFAANRRSGSISVINVKDGRVVAESEVGRSLVDVAVLPDGHILAVDREADALVILTHRESAVEVESRVPIAPGPVSVLVAPDGSSCVVASTLARQLSVIFLPIEVNGRIAAKLSKAIDLPFGPRLMSWAAPGSRLVAADAYGGRIALVDPTRDAPESIRSIPAHNIRGLAATPDGRGLVVAHQTLNRLARSTFEDVHWGSLLGNHLRFLQIDAVLTPDADLLKGARVVDIGRTGRAAGDPGAIAFDRQGRMAVALTGVQEVALYPDSQSYYAKRIEVGQGPSAVLPSPDGSVVYVADSLDDTISVVEVATAKKLRTIVLGPRPDLGSIERGERLFADARLSHDGWMSCQSCHTDGHTNGLSADTLTDLSFGAPKRITSLLGVGSTGPWTWLGSTNRLEDQVRKSIETTMRGRTPSIEQVDDLTAYLRSIPPPRPPGLAIEDGNDSADRGREIFRVRRCAECHTAPEYTSERSYDVGLLDEVGNRKFNPPSLRGVGDRAPFLHDGRAATLADVFLRHRHPKESGWSTLEVDDLVAFLKTL